VRGTKLGVNPLNYDEQWPPMVIAAVEALAISTAILGAARQTLRRKSRAVAR
jgi:hypothetical protein